MKDLKKEKAPQRIVSLAPSYTEILFALGLGDRVVGVTRYCNYPEEAREKTIIEGFANPDLDKIISLKPDLILSLGTIQKPLVRELEERGQNVYWTYPHSINDILESFEKIGELTGSLSEAQKLRSRVEERLEAVRSRLKNITERDRPGVFRLMRLSPPGTVGGDAFQTDFYHTAGGKNIFADTDKDFFETDFETLAELAPDIIVVAAGDRASAEAGLKNQAGWQSLPAVKAGRILALPAELICRPGLRVAETVERLAREFHPALFR